MVQPLDARIPQEEVNQVTSCMLFPGGTIVNHLVGILTGH
jgi:hypothetical protein